MKISFRKDSTVMDSIIRIGERSSLAVVHKHPSEVMNALEIINKVKGLVRKDLC